MYIRSSDELASWVCGNLCPFNVYSNAHNRHKKQNDIYFGYVNLYFSPSSSSLAYRRSHTVLLLVRAYRTERCDSHLKLVLMWTECAIFYRWLGAIVNCLLKVFLDLISGRLSSKMTKMAKLATNCIDIMKMLGYVVLFIVISCSFALLLKYREDRKQRMIEHKLERFQQLQDLDENFTRCQYVSSNSKRIWSHMKRQEKPRKRSPVQNR